MEHYLNKPLYTYRIFCEGGHLFTACLPERTEEEALKSLETNGTTSWYFIDAVNNVKRAAVFYSKIVGVDSLSKDPIIIKNVSGTLKAFAYDQKSEKIVEEPKKPSVGRVARKGW